MIQSYADYYPFGEQLPERNSTSGYRYAFQGQEKDPETGMEAFQLRLWDGRIGRWLSPDPYGQYASPYLGMGNNPVSMIDPDGGFASGPGDPGKGFWGRVWGGIKSAFGGGNRGSEYQSIPNEIAYSVNLDGLVITRSNSHINNGVDSHLIYASGYSADYGALGSTRNGFMALPQNFGSWNSAGSDGRMWIGCMACHGDNGAYRTLAYNSPSRYAGLMLAQLLDFGSSRLPSPGVQVNEASIANALKNSKMQTIQGKVSLPMVERYVAKLQNGSTAPAIKVANNVIIEGNHRYVAGRLMGIEPDIIPGRLSPSDASRVVPIQKTKVDPSDWGGH